MSDDSQIAVVKPYYQIDEAYKMGYNRFVGGETVGEDEDPEIHHFYDTAAYANHVLPRLRSMAGYNDTGPGTYTVERQIAAIEPGCEEDEPAEARLVQSRFLFKTLSDAWERGAIDALRGKEEYASELPQW
jgi:hypothetical protein